MEITPPKIQFTLEEDIPTKIVEKEVIKEVPVDREKIVERPVFVDREKIVQVPELKTEEFYKLVANINSRVQEVKDQFKEVSNQMKYLASDPQQIKKVSSKIDTLEKELKSTIETIGPTTYKNVESIRQEVVKLSQYVQNISKPKDHTRDFQNIIEILNSIGKPDLSKIDSISQYLTVLKQSVDKIKVNPEVKVTTQKIEDTATKEKLEEFTKSINALTNLISTKTKDTDFKLDVVKSLNESNIPLIQDNLKSIVELINKNHEKNPQLFTKILSESKIVDEIKHEIDSIIETNSKEFIKHFASVHHDTKQSIGEEFKAYREEFVRELNQRLFDITLDLKSSIHSILKEELEKSLSSIKLDTPDSPEVTMLSLISTIRETLRNERQPRVFIVSDVHSMNMIEDQIVGDSVLVKKVSFWKRNRLHTWNGTFWKTY